MPVLACATCSVVTASKVHNQLKLVQYQLAESNAGRHHLDDQFHSISCVLCIRYDSTEPACGKHPPEVVFHLLQGVGKVRLDLAQGVLNYALQLAINTHYLHLTYDNMTTEASFGHAAS